MAWNPQCPQYPDQESRDAYRAGYSDGYYNYPQRNGDWPIQPYSRGFHEGAHDLRKEWEAFR